MDRETYDALAKARIERAKELLEEEITREWLTLKEFVTILITMISILQISRNASIKL